jgi:plasmid stabilization system protein ParE
VIRVQWTLQAVEDLAAIRDFIARDSKHYAEVVIERLLAAVEQLARFPDSGRVVPELEHPEIREVIRRPYRIVYRRRTEVVEILTVFHASRRIPNLDPGADLI